MSANQQFRKTQINLSLTRSNKGQGILMSFAKAKIMWKTMVNSLRQGGEEALQTWIKLLMTLGFTSSTALIFIDLALNIRRQRTIPAAVRQELEGRINLRREKSIYGQMGYFIYAISMMVLAFGVGAAWTTQRFMDTFRY